MKSHRRSLIDHLPWAVLALPALMLFAPSTARADCTTPIPSPSGFILPFSTAPGEHGASSSRAPARLPCSGPQCSQHRPAEKGDLKPQLKAQVSWIIARQDRAWYAVGEAKRHLREMKASDDQIYKLDGDWADFTPSERALFTVARKLAASPVVSTDDDVAAAVKLAGPRDVVQLISYTTNQASFDRITEVAGLQLEER